MRRDVETQTSLAAKANAEAARLKQVADSDSTELKRSLQKEHERAEGLAQDLSMVHTAIYAYDIQARMASDQAAGLKQAADASAVELRKSLVQEGEREARLQQDVETQTALAAKANDEAARLKQAAESGSAELRQSLQRERDKVAQLERDLASARSKDNVVARAIAVTDRINTQSEVAAAKPLVTEQAVVEETRTAPTVTPGECCRSREFAGARECAARAW